MTAPVEIHLLDKKLRLLQPAQGFRTSLDSVILAAACPAEGGGHILDLGCGVGGAGLCTLYRAENARLTGIDIQDDYIKLAVRNAALNGVEGRAAFETADVRDFEGSGFDHVICNPPYLEAGAHTRSPQAGLARARGHEVKDLSVKDWIDTAFRALKSKGTFSLIHRADQTDTIIRALGKKFGAIEIFPLWPRTGKPAKRAVIRAVKDRRSPATLHAGLVLHAADGAYTPEAEKILRQGACLF